MRVLVCGDWTDEHKHRLYACLDRLHRQHLFDVVIEGDKPGTDRMAGFWARKRGLDNLKFPPAKKLHRAAAVPLKNEEMLVKGRPVWVVAFLLDDLPDMVIRARQRCIPVSEVRLVKSWYNIVNAQEEMAPVEGIEPSSAGLEAAVLPLNDTGKDDPARWPFGGEE